MHPQVVHPKEFAHKEQPKLIRLNDWLVTHLAIVFGLTWTIWVFFIYPLVLLTLPEPVQQKGFFLSSGWVQLWALPLFVYVGNKLQKSTDAQSDAWQQALTHIAVVSDENKKLIEINNKLTQEIHELTREVHAAVNTAKGSKK